MVGDFWLVCLRLIKSPICATQKCWLAMVGLLALALASRYFGFGVPTYLHWLEELTQKCIISFESWLLGLMNDYSFAPAVSVFLGVLAMATLEDLSSAEDRLPA